MRCGGAVTYAMLQGAPCGLLSRHRSTATASPAPTASVGRLPYESTKYRLQDPLPSRGSKGIIPPGRWRRAGSGGRAAGSRARSGEHPGSQRGGISPSPPPSASSLPPREMASALASSITGYDHITYNHTTSPLPPITGTTVCAPPRYQGARPPYCIHDHHHHHPRSSTSAG